MAHKICPKCKSPAPLEATYCGQCGRQYKTRFVGTLPPAIDSPTSGGSIDARSVSALNAERPTPNTGRRTPNLSVAIVVMSVVVAALILTVVQRGRTGFYSSKSSSSVDQPAALPRSRSEQAAADLESPADDRGSEVPTHTLEPDNLGPLNAPPAGAIGPDGRIHLRGGGSITREQWDEANRRIRRGVDGRE
jgi:hypothetical protein